MQLYTCSFGEAWEGSAVQLRDVASLFHLVTRLAERLRSAVALRWQARELPDTHPGAVGAVAERPLLAVHLNRPMKNTPNSERIPRESVERFDCLIRVAIRRVRDIVHLRINNDDVKACLFLVIPMC